MGALRRSLTTFVALAAFLGAPEARADGFFAEWPVALQTDVVKASKRFGGEFALYVKDLKSGVEYSYNADTPMYLASGVKVPVMIALYKQIRAGQTKLDEEMIYTEADVRDGAPLLSFLRVGTPVSLRILLEAMIQQSDNAATDMVIRHVGLENVNRTLQQQGVYGFGPITTLIDVRRLVYKNLDVRTSKFSPQDIFRLGTTRPLEARVALITELLEEPPGMITVVDYNRAFSEYYAKGYNSASMRAMGDLLEKLARGKMIDDTASKQMMDVMLGTQTGGRRIRAGLPLDTPLAHKTGTQYRRTCDFSIFFMTKDRPIIFAISVKHSGRKAAEALMSRLARRAYFHLATPRQRALIRGRTPPPVTAPDPEAQHDPEEEDLLMAPLLDKKPKKTKQRKKRRRKRGS